MQNSKELQDLIEVEKIEEYLFRGKNNFMGSPSVFGGQLLAQSLNAASQTVHQERLCHSLHGYFISPGNLSLAIDYQVENLRDGGAFSSRIVTATQANLPIFTVTASFQKQEFGPFHQMDMPAVEPPERALSWMELPDIQDVEKLKRLKLFMDIERPIEMRACQSTATSKTGLNNEHRVWIRFKEVPKDLSAAHIQQLILYASDYNILNTALRPYANQFHYANTHVASLDHSIWFHQKADISDWLLFDMISPIASDARGFARGHLYSRTGKLIATVAQEGLLRPHSNSI